jgi:dsDNA-specific endonuclease/ATPase MutS2
MKGERRDLGGGRTPELDLHGMNVERAKDEIDRFLIEQINAGNSLVKIVHGWGTGKLQREIGEYLKTHSDVKKIHPPLNTNEAAFLLELN